MDNVRFYKIVILILVLLNLGTLAFLWLWRPGAGVTKRHDRPSEFLMRELRLTPSQRDEFGRLRHEHLYRLTSLQRRERALHERFFSEALRLDPDTLRMKDLIDSMASTRSRMEILTFDHFRQLSRLLDSEQKARFDKVFLQALDRAIPLPEPVAAPEPPPPPPVPKDKGSK